MTEPLVQKVSHALVPVADPAPYLTLFTETLGLPAAWTHDYGIFRGGGVCLGNANLEFVAGDAGANPHMQPTEPLTVRGISFDATTSEGWAAAVSARDLAYLGPVPFQGGGRSRGGLLWTLLYIGDLIGEAAAVSLIQYHADETTRGERARAALADSGGGVLGVGGVAEIQIGVSDMEDVEPRWRRLLAPAEPDRYGLFRLPEGPGIRLRSSPMDGVSGIVLEVASLEAAREALREREMLGPTRRSGVGLDYARTGGLDVWLTESR